jgi:hypothetical protein
MKDRPIQHAWHSVSLVEKKSRKRGIDINKGSREYERGNDG